MQEEKLAPRLRIDLHEAPDEEELPIIVRLHPHAIAVRTLESTAAQPRYTFRLVPAIATRACRADITIISRRPEVAHIWADEPVYSCLDSSAPVIRAPQVWDSQIDGQGIRIAIVDTGIDETHPDLDGRIFAVTDFTGEGPRDNNGHGTHVASIAAGNGTASEGRYRGIAPAAEICAAKVLRGNGSGMMSDVMAGVEWAVEQRAQVINLSLGSRGPCNGTDAISTACDAAVAAGHVVCVAAGNEGPGERTIGSPGCARSPITVGASTDDDQVAGFSSRGPTSDGRAKPDLVFPGSGIIAARATGTQMGTPIDDRYTLASGTSMATPHATGLAALLLQTNPVLTPDEIKALMTKSARNLGLPENTQGAGRADAYDAYLLAQGFEPEPTPTPPPPPPTPTPTPPPPDDRPGCSPAGLAFWRRQR